MGDRNNLLKQIQICELALFEAVLYLDTHKTDQEAIAYHKKHLAMLQEYRSEYVKKYGPLQLMILTMTRFGNG